MGLETASGLKYADPRRRTRPGVASRYIREFDVKPGDSFVLWCRVSHENQRGHLAHQELLLREAVGVRGGTVVACFRFVGTGKEPANLSQAVDAAREAKAVLLAESTDRFVRSSLFHAIDMPTARANEYELSELARESRGVTLMTLLNPDATPNEVHGFQTGRGQIGSGNAGGRPPLQDKARGCRARRKAKLLCEVLKLHAAGLSYRKIEFTIHEEHGETVSRTTVMRWVHGFRMQGHGVKGVLEESGT